LPRDIVAEFHKSAGGRLSLRSLIVLYEEISRHDGKAYLSRDLYDVDYSRCYGYLFHMSGAGGDLLNEVRGIYWVSGNPLVKELPTDLVDHRDKPPWKSKRTLAVRKVNRTRRLRKLPKAFDLQPGWDLLDWLENRAIHDEAVYCSVCRDWLPGEELCQHCWWCDKSGWYSTPDERCKCKSREECQN
jgi:hypothetical protein